MNKTAIIVCGILGVLVGMGLVMPAVALLRDTGALPGFEIALLFLGVTLTGGGAWAAVHGIRRQRV